MKLTDCSAVFVEALCVYETLLVLGFKGQDIYFVADDGNGEAAIVLSTQDRDFFATVGSISGDKKEIEDQWEAFGKKAASGAFTKEEFREVMSKSDIRKKLRAFIEALLNFGFVIPKSGVAA